MSNPLNIYAAKTTCVRGMRVVLSTVLIATAVGCATTENPAPRRECSKRVLFVGNSYTYVNDLPSRIAALSAQMGCELKWKEATAPGARFSTHVQSTDTQTLLSESWDVVILQNQSQEPSWAEPSFTANSLPYAQQLVRQAKTSNPDVRLLYFVTWGRRDGDASNCEARPEVCSFKGHTKALLGGYKSYASSTGGELVDVGGAFLKVQDKLGARMHSRLYADDGSHPSELGSDLSAYVFVLSLWGEEAVRRTRLADDDKVHQKLLALVLRSQTDSPPQAESN